MIVPMYHYSFLVFHADYDAFVKNLKEIGVAHMVEHKNDPTTEMEEQIRLISELSQRIKKFEKRADKVQVSGDKYKTKDGKELYRWVNEIEQEIEQLQQEKSSLEKTHKQVLPWGYFTIDNIQKIEDQGLRIRFLICPVK